MEFLREIDPASIESFGANSLFGWIILVILLERIYPYTSGIKLFRRGFWMDLVWYTLIQSYLLKILIFDWIIRPVKEWLTISENGIISHWPIWILIIFFLITHDLYIYWFHRLQHTNKFFWRTHEAHHSVRECDWLAGSRSHPLEILINQTIEFAPIIILLDISTAAIIVPIKAFLDAVWGIYIHSNLNIPNGWYSKLINGPEMHQWHHANHKEVFHANFATKFSLFDYLFGTAYEAVDSENIFIKPKMYGLPYAYPKDFFLQTYYAIRRFKLEIIQTNFLFNAFHNIRASIILKLTPDQSRNLVLNFLFDRHNKKYALDEEMRKCEDCGHLLTYYYEEDSLQLFCANCKQDRSWILSKFDLK